jgi:branched-chain amino acid transport system ATP-binding protein
VYIYAARIVHAPEGRSVFAPLSVENLELTFRRSRGRMWHRARRAYALFPRLGERRRQLAGTLSGARAKCWRFHGVLVEKPGC